jgi:predicted acyltransferase
VGVSLLFTWLLCRNPFALYQETTFGITERAGALFVMLSNLHFYLPSRLPSFIKIEEGSWTPNIIWITALVLFFVSYLFVRGRGIKLSFAGHSAAVSVLLAGFFAMYVFFPRPVLMSPQIVTFPTGEKWAFYPFSLVARMGEAANFALFQDDRDYVFFFATRNPLAKLDVEFGSPYGDYSLRLMTADDPAFTVTTRREVLTRTIESPPAYRWKELSLYRISIRLDKKSAVRTAVTPYVFALRPGR